MYSLKKNLCLFLIFILNVSFCVSASENIDSFENYKLALRQLKLSNIIMGPDVDDSYYYDKFDQLRSSRAESAVVIFRWLNMEETDYINHETIFTDCADDHWAANYIKGMHEIGIVSGYGDGTFRPNEYITEYELVTMLVRALEYEDFPTEHKEYPKKYIEIAEKTNLLKGTQISMSGDKEITYGETLLLLFNAFYTLNI